MDADIPVFDEERLRSTDLFYQIYSVSPASIIVDTMNDRRFVAMNDGFVRLSGYNREEILGKTVEEFGVILQPTDKNRIFRKLEEGQTLRWEEAEIQ